MREKKLQKSERDKIFIIIIIIIIIKISSTALFGYLSSRKVE